MRMKCFQSSIFHRARSMHGFLSISNVHVHTSSLYPVSIAEECHLTYCLISTFLTQVLRCDKFGTNALNALTDRFHLQNVETTHIAGALHMWTTTYLHRIVPDLINLDYIAIAISEESQRSLIERLLQWHHFHSRLQITRYLLVYHLLNSQNFFTRQFLRM